MARVFGRPRRRPPGAELRPPRPAIAPGGNTQGVNRRLSDTWALGGLITATLLTLLVLPALYKRFCLNEEFTADTEAKPQPVKEHIA